MGLLSDREASGEALGESGEADALLRGLDVVLEAAVADRALLRVVDDVRRARIAVAGLPYRADVMRKTPFIDFSYIIGQWVWPWKQTGVFWLRKFASACRLSKT